MSAGATSHSCTTACVCIWSLCANGAARVGRCTGRVVRTQFAAHALREHGHGVSNCAGCKMRPKTENRIPSVSVWRRVSRSDSDLSALSLGFYTNALQQRSFSTTRRLEIGSHFNAFVAGGNARYGRVSTCLSQAQDNWPVSQPCLLYTSPSPRDGLLSRMPSSA